MGKLFVGLFAVVSLAGMVLLTGFLVQSPPIAGQEAGQFQVFVEIEGIGTSMFKSVEGLDIETDVIEFREAGQAVVRKLSGPTKLGNITLKRGFAQNDNLWDWYSVVRNGGIERKEVFIILKDSQGREVLRYHLSEAWPCGWSGPRQVAPGVVIPDETICITYETVERHRA